VESGISFSIFRSCRAKVADVETAINKTDKGINRWQIGAQRSRESGEVDTLSMRVADTKFGDAKS
jgi:hypothetical protein